MHKIHETKSNFPFAPAKPGTYKMLPHIFSRRLIEGAFQNQSECNINTFAFDLLPAAIICTLLTSHSARAEAVRETATAYSVSMQKFSR